MFTECLRLNKIPQQWKEANMIILHKKGNKKDFKNYRLISLLSNIYKLFTKIITSRLERVLDDNQPREQAGFRKNFSTVDHIHTLCQLKEKCQEYNIPLCLAFVDYEKAFDSVETNAVLKALMEQGVSSRYVALIKDIYSGCTTKSLFTKKAIQYLSRKELDKGIPYPLNYSQHAWKASSER